MSTHSLEINGLAIDRGSTRIVDDFDLALAPGEYCVVLGPSGCGKSTLLHCIAGLLDAACGSISIDRQDVTHVTARKRDVGLLFQHDTMYPHLTVEQTLQIACRVNLNGRPPATVTNQKIQSMLRTLNLDPAWLPRRPETLSGGQRRRVALAKTLIREPSVCLLDEPMAAIDRLAAENLMQHLADVSRQTDSTTFVHVTHDGDEAMRLADKIVVMSNGCILQTGTPREIYQSPNCTAVALALGSPSCNLLPMDEVLRSCPNLGEALQSPPGYTNSELALMIRPEAIELVEPDLNGQTVPTVTKTGMWRFPVTLLEQRDLGGRHLLQLQRTGHENSPLLSATTFQNSIPSETGTRWSCQVPVAQLRVVAESLQHSTLSTSTTCGRTES
ncbi:ABC transporter ATP-binding protein [Rhodopirellula baltica]